MGEIQPNRRVQVRVTGRVQGVGYRFFARDRARALGLSGWVRNEYDGSVSVVAEGPEADLRALLDALRLGPATGRVDHLTTDWQEAEGAFGGFTIR